LEPTFEEVISSVQKAREEQQEKVQVFIKNMNERKKVGLRKKKSAKEEG
jgi:hypothetical protein